MKFRVRPNPRPSVKRTVKRRRWPRPLVPARPKPVAGSKLENRRKELERRLNNLRPAAKASQGYRTARALLGNKYVHAKVAARVGLIEAADFLIRVLEMFPI